MPIDAAKVALKIFAAIPTSTGAMIGNKMPDDSAGQQAKVLVDLSNVVAGKDAEMKERYRLRRCGRKSTGKRSSI
jgi:hypothetical protein